MARIITSEALVLKMYDVRDADKFCILLTAARGRMAVTAKSARKSGSRLGASLQSFQCLRADVAEHSSGMYLRSAQCIETFDAIRRDPARFLLASRGAELLLHFLHDTEPLPAIYALAREYFALCAASPNDLLFPAFQIMLLKELGLLPAFDDGRHNFSLRAFLASRETLTMRINTSLDSCDHRKLTDLCDSLLYDHISFPLRSTGVVVA